MKIVVNKCFGGFGISHKAILRYAEIKGIKLYHKREGCMYYYSKSPFKKVDQIKNEDHFSNYDIQRDDPVLVQVVEELHDEANGDYAKLRITEIPDGVNWEIDDYDGMESVHEVHRSW